MIDDLVNRFLELEKFHLESPDCLRLDFSKIHKTPVLFSLISAKFDVGYSHHFPLLIRTLLLIDSISSDSSIMTSECKKTLQSNLYFSTGTPSEVHHQDITLRQCFSIFSSKKTLVSFADHEYYKQKYKDKKVRAIIHEGGYVDLIDDLLRCIVVVKDVYKPYVVQTRKLTNEGVNLIDLIG